MRGSRTFPRPVSLQTCPSCSQKRGDGLRCPSASQALPQPFRPGSVRGEAVPSLSNQVAPLSSRLVLIIPPDWCKGTTTLSLGGFNPFTEGEQGKMGLSGGCTSLVLCSPVEGKGAGLNQGVFLHGEPVRADSPSLPGASQLQVAPKALGREERGRARHICRIWEPALQAAGRDGPHPSTSILIPPPLQSWGPRANPLCPPKPGGNSEPSSPRRGWGTPGSPLPRSHMGEEPEQPPPCIPPAACQHSLRSRG